MTGDGTAEAASVWPVPTALGVAGLYATAALAVLGDAVPPWSVAVAAALAVGSLAVGVGGWVCRWTLSGAGEPTRSRSLDVAVAAFLVTEAATFGCAFAAFLFLWAGPWSLRPLPPIRPPATLAATLVLLASSATLHEARAAARRDGTGAFDRYLSVTIGLGALFLVGQAGEYHELYAAGVTPTSGAYAAAFYGLTGLHGLHVLGVSARWRRSARSAAAAEPRANRPRRRSAGTGTSSTPSGWCLSRRCTSASASGRESRSTAATSPRQHAGRSGASGHAHADTMDENATHLRQEVGRAALYQAAIGAVGLAGSVLFARRLGPDAFGSYALLYALAEICNRSVSGVGEAAKNASAAAPFRPVRPSAPPS
ncbi:heme-copper oxidase subunit III [Halosimplex aquaticum]